MIYEPGNDNLERGKIKQKRLKLTKAELRFVYAEIVRTKSGLKDDI